MTTPHNSTELMLQAFDEGDISRVIVDRFAINTKYQIV